ncbi:MAG: hypothetical protein ACOVT5_00375 [Armatimonadaceae bacterium]
MNRSAERPTLPEVYFDHVAKTAGTSVVSVLRSAYARQEMFPVHHCDKMVGWPRDSVAGYRCYHGHLGTLVPTLLGRDIPTVTLLRDPFEQTISLFRHALRHHYRDEKGWSQSRLQWVLRWTFPYAVHHLTQPANRAFHNYQTRSLGVLLDFERLGKPGGSMNEQFSVPDSALPEALERAKRRLDSMVLVGTVEEIDTFVVRLCALLGVEPPARTPSLNTDPGRDIRRTHRESCKLPAYLVRRIDRLTRFDQELYAHARALAGEHGHPQPAPTLNRSAA